MAQTLPLFSLHPNLSDTVNRHIIQSEIEGGVFLADLPPASVLEIQTQHHDYRAVTLSENSVLISGHPEFCPEPVVVAIAGSTWGGSMLKRGFVGRGMRLEFSHPAYRAPITTSRIKEIRECSKHSDVGTVASPIACLPVMLRRQPDTNRGTDHPQPQPQWKRWAQRIPRGRGRCRRRPNRPTS